MPALLLRAVIPVGFMPLAGPAGAHLGFCPGAGPVPPAAGGHAHHPGGAPGSSGTHQPCVFSGGATTEFAAILSAVLATPTLQSPSERVTSLVFLPTILRAQSSRGPPRGA